jgi:hypothetical protein
MRVLKIHKAELPPTIVDQPYGRIGFLVECGQLYVNAARAKIRWRGVTCLKCLWRRKGT